MNLSFYHLCLTVSHNRNEIDLIWSGSTADVKTIQGLLIANSETTMQIDNIHRKTDKTGNFNVGSIINNSPLIKYVKTSPCSGEAWKGKYRNLMYTPYKN